MNYECIYDRSPQETHLAGGFSILSVCMLLGRVGMENKKSLELFNASIQSRIVYSSAYARVYI
jgi:hypothetical protein